MGKITGLRYNEILAKVHFWTIFVGVNVTFFPIHFLGLSGIPRRIPDYPDAYHILNWICSIGSIVSFFSTLIFIGILYELFAENKPFDTPQAAWGVEAKGYKTLLAVTTIE